MNEYFEPEYPQNQHPTLKVMIALVKRVEMLREKRENLLTVVQNTLVEWGYGGLF